LPAIQGFCRTVSPSHKGQWSGLTLGLLAAAGWLTIGFVFLEYREPRIVMAIFATLLIGVALTAA
jgi:hypothetical protein